MLLFVYGTLKKGHGNHGLIEDCEHVGNFYTDKSLTLLVAGLPFLVKREGAGALGEVYRIDKDILRAVDRLEGHPSFYKREKITVTNIDDGSQVEAYVYLHPDTFNKRNFPWEYRIVREY